MCDYYCFKLIMSHSVPEKGEVLSTHYKLVPADLRDVQQLNDIITLADMDPKYVFRVSSVFLSLLLCTIVKFCYLTFLIICLKESTPSKKKYKIKLKTS